MHQPNPRTPTVAGSPNWVDLSTSDTAAAQEFYAALLGWTFESVETGMGTYHLASTTAGPVGGMMSLSPEMAAGPSFWTLFFGVEDVDVTVSKVEAAGGATLHPPIDLEDGTRVIAVTDATGAMFGLSSAPTPGDYLSQGAGAVGWCELMTRTPTESTRFYADVFGWTASAETTDDGIVYTVYAVGEYHAGGMIQTPDHVAADVPDNWSVYFSVDDCAETEAQTIALGGSVLLPTSDTPMGPFAVLADPQGAVFQIMEYRTDAPS